MLEILFSPLQNKNQVESDKHTLEDLVIQLLKTKNKLLDISIEDLIIIFDQLSKDWQSKDSEVYDIFVKNNIGFLITWLKKKNISSILDSSLTKREVLDRPTLINDKKLYASPKGLVVHWIAGNVPLLGILSLFQSILAKNKNIVKVPKSFKNVLPLIIEDIAKKDFRIKEKIINGADIVSSILILYVEKDDIFSQSILSKYADVRYAWGGREAIESIVGLSKKIECEDLIMGPKTSISILSKDYLNDSEIMFDISNKIVKDVFAFDQRGCNAPHNIYVESEDKYSLIEFAKVLEDRFQSEAAKRNNLDKQPIDTFNILSERVLYSISEGKETLFDDSYEYSIFIDALDNLSSAPLFNRSVYLKAIKKIEDCPKLFPKGLQSVGIAIPKDKLDSFCILASKFGALRITNIGSMSIYDSPWDGIFPINRLVKWIPLPKN